MKFPFRKRTTKKYVVCVNERWHRFYEVEAENTNDAREAVEFGLAQEVDGNFEFVERSKSDTWVVADPDTGEVLYE
jgi:hypothetical protein